MSSRCHSSVPLLRLCHMCSTHRSTKDEDGFKIAKMGTRAMSLLLSVLQDSLIQVWGCSCFHKYLTETRTKLFVQHCKTCFVHKGWASLSHQVFYYRLSSSPEERACAELPLQQETVFERVLQFIQHRHSEIQSTKAFPSHFL